MKLRMEEGLPLVSLSIEHGSRSIELHDVLLDTGCAKTIFDTDLLEQVGIELDIINGTAKRMYGVGGHGELCYEQTVKNIRIDSVLLPSFPLQLGMTREAYGFDGILGIDFMLKAGMCIDLSSLTVSYKNE